MKRPKPWARERENERRYFELEKFKCLTYRSHVRPCGLLGLLGLLLSHTRFFPFVLIFYLTNAIALHLLLIDDGNFY